MDYVKIACENINYYINIFNHLIKEKVPNTLIYVWSGYEFDDLIVKQDNHVNAVLEQADYLIDGPYIEALRDLTLALRGSSNQKVINLTEQRKNGII